MYKKNQFDSVIRFTNLQMQQKKPLLELRLEEFRNARANLKEQMTMEKEKPVRGEPVYHSI